MSLFYYFFYEGVLHLSYTWKNEIKPTYSEADYTVWHKSLVHLEYVLISRDWKEISGWLKRHCVSRDERMKDQWSKFQSYNRLPADGETGFGQKKGVRVFWWNKLYTLRQIKCDMFFWNRFVSLQPVVDNPPEKGATKKFLKQKL